ncbi:MULTISPECIES: molecular chaperone DnaJ [Nocardioides]|uniref:molecular chaperone DnaJ n=1 Tax=Nocardioides TaxID=1839 RepID=UPI00032FA4AD|nr:MULTISPECIES: molecular chaperone DnaJ [Nocardioides]EON22626.1 chaperone protein DnaJ [Nocardioides sp. CF8]
MADKNDGFRNDWAAKDFYAVLGVSKDATADDIKKAYRKLARANHPDSNPDDAKKHDTFKSVAEAYDVVGDADKRKKYDEFRALTAGGGGFGGFNRGGAGQGGFDINDLLRDQAGGAGFGDMFGDLFGGGGARQQRQARPRKGADLEATTTIGFVDALDGTTISLRLTSDAACPTCKGTGGKPGTRPHICPECEGAGYVVAGVGGAFSMNETCPTCHGRQLVYDEACPVCHGTGRGTSARTVQARIPAGVKDGQKIRLRGKGSPGESGGPAGDLIVAIKVAGHPVFGRKGDNLTIEVPVSFDEAALGGDIKIPTLGGAPVTLKVPAGTPNGRTFRVRGKGARKPDGTHGDLLATIAVVVPATLDEAAREALATYRAATASTPVRDQLFRDAQ